MNIHGFEFPLTGLAGSPLFIIHTPCSIFHKKKRPLKAAFSYLGLRA